MRGSAPHGAAPRRGAAGTGLDTARRAATRDRLVAAALDVFAEVGVHAATVEQVAERAGFTRGAFYSNFSSKEELFFALMDRETAIRLSGLVERLEAMRPRLAGPLSVDELAEMLVDVLWWAVSDRRWSIVMDEFRLMALRDPDLAADFLARRDELFSWVRRSVEQVLDGTGRHFTFDADLAVRLIISTYLDSVRDDVLRGATEGDTLAIRLNLARLVLALTAQAGPEADA